MFKVLSCIGTRHDWRLVAVAAVVCVVATAATLYLYSKSPARGGGRRLAWFAMAGLVAGCGIWATHFVGMLAFRTGLPNGFSGLETSLSLVVAVVTVTVGLALAGTAGPAGPAGLARRLVGGTVFGLGITAMHYVGMLGYRTAGHLIWNPAYVTSSAIVATVLSAVALATAKPKANFRSQWLAGGLLVMAIVGMHFTGMTAVTILPDPQVAVPPALLSNAGLAAFAVVVASMSMVTSTLGVILDTMSRDGSHRRLREALDSMQDGIAFFDADDRLAAWNARYAEQCIYLGCEAAVGLSFTDIIAAGIANGAIPDAIGRHDEWLVECMAQRFGGAESSIQRTKTGWVRITERRTREGGMVCNFVDITDMKQTEAALAGALNRAESAEALAGLGHWRIDGETKKVTWSEEVYRIHGVDPQGDINVDAVYEFCHPDDREMVRSGLSELFRTGQQADNLAVRIVRPTGEVRHLTCNARSERNGAGRVTGILGTAMDVTERVQAEQAIVQSEERFRRLASNAPDIIAESTVEGVLTYVSPASLAITGFTPEELIGRRFGSLMHPDDVDQVWAMCKAVFASKGALVPWPVEFRARHKDGHALWLECKPTLAVDPETGEAIGLNDVIRDITTRKRMEADLRAARADAEAASAVKGEFLANMSHELRTPLTSIIGFTGLAAEQADLSELTRNYVNRVAHASRALLCTVNDILDFSKLEAGQVAIHPRAVRIADLTQATLELFTPQAGAKDLDLILDDDCDGQLVAEVDSDRVRQVLLNLVSNAVKFTDHGAVTLRSRYDLDAQTLTIEVIDTGGGIADEEQVRLFQRFSQIDGSLTRTQGGTGLGLAICKGLIEAMGGEIGLESKPGFGSRFWFRIPAPAGVLADRADAAPAPERLTFDGVRVLVVDDHPTNRELARLYLAGVGAEVSEASDGREAVEQAATWPFDVILMDLRMPNLDGFGALRQIRAAQWLNNATPCLAFSADVNGDIGDDLLDAGFDGVVAKPVQAETLIRAVAEASAFAPPRRAQG